MRRTHESTVLLFGKSFLLLLRWMHIVLFYLTAVIHSHNRANKKKKKKPPSKIEVYSGFIKTSLWRCCFVEKENSDESKRAYF